MAPTKTEHLKILMAEDEGDIASLASSVLQDAGHAVDIARDGQAALARMTEDLGLYDLLITDNRMPKLSGSQLIQEIRKQGFRGKIIVASSSAASEPQAAENSLLVDRILQKPYRMADLCDAVEDLYSIPLPARLPEPASDTPAIRPDVAFSQITRFALWQFAFWAVLDSSTTCIGLRAGWIEGNPFTASTMDLFGPAGGLFAKEIFVTAPLCVGGGYLCFRMAKHLALRERVFAGNAPVYVGVFLHAVASLNNLWVLAS